MNNEGIEQLTIKELLRKDEYRIPIYQRNYAWGLGETTQLVQDIVDYAKDSSDKNYYIGNLIVFQRQTDNGSCFETIDGQQRVTTLTILLCATKNSCNDYELSWYSKLNLSFDHREKSNLTLSALYDNKTNLDDANANIMAVYNKAWSIVDKICQDKGMPVSDFMDYLLNKVIILRICVPKDTNLNHYFEIMNSRGEQLEQHEIVKASLMSHVKEDRAAMDAFNWIWEACSHMDRYVQLNFPKDMRKQIFDNKGTEDIKISFGDLAEALRDNMDTDSGNNDSEFSLERLFDEAAKNTEYEKPWEESPDKEDPETFRSLISFPNFLLHVLKIIRPNNKDIALDDKRLTRIFDGVIESENDKAGFSREFIKKLLVLRFLFDKYIIKRKQEKWSLKKLAIQQKDYYYKDTFSRTDCEDDESGQNREIIMLQSMFHVSAPAQTYKHWMNACLYYVYHNRYTSVSEYKEYLWNLSKAYILDRFLATPDKRVAFETIIYDNEGKSVNLDKDIVWENINIDVNKDEEPQAGEHVENFVFNFYDYLLWKKKGDKDFEFSYRNSVEHFYPQHPTGGERMDSRHLHAFGNLCLVSSGMNSKFSNNMPEAKVANFGDDNAMKTYSLKLKDMMDTVKKGKKWDENTIAQKEQEAKELISMALSGEKQGESFL